MKLAIKPIESRRGTKKPAARRAGFTLAEVMAALLFLAIVIPTAVEVLRIATLAGEVAARKSEAARVADRILSESVVTTNWSGAMQSGTVREGILDFRWTLTSGAWSQNPMPQAQAQASQMELLTAEVTYSAQGKDYSVKSSTLANAPTANAGAQQ
jgi:hypothetical protein